MAPFTELSLFSGAGGGLLGTQHLLGWRTVCYVEWDEYAVNVLKQRIADGYLCDAPIWDDAFTFDGRPWAGLVDVVTAGFPCQPFSVAGKGLAENDPRNGFPAVIRILREVRPRFALLENVPGLISKPYFHTILGELSEAGFDLEWDCISAAEVGANHKRERLWILATNTDSKPGVTEPESQYKGSKEFTGSGKNRMEHGRAVVSNADSLGRLEGQDEIQPTTGRFETLSRSAFNGGEVSDADGGRCEQRNEKKRKVSISDKNSGSADWWAVEPELGRLADGVPNRVDRLKATGNGQVPAVVREAWNTLSGRN